MITAERLKEMIGYGPGDVALLLARSGYTGCSFENAEFVGITNASEFCYRVRYWDDGGGPEEVLEDAKVFVKLDKDTQQLKADF